MTELWRITPRDPLVLGDGRGGVPYVARQTWRLPIPSTAAGFVRSGFLAHLHLPDKADAEAVLRGVSIRGPWMVQAREDGALSHHFFPPADVLVDADGRIIQGEVVKSDAGEGVSWPGAIPPPPGWVRLAERGAGRGGGPLVKRRPPRATVWPLKDLVAFALGVDVPAEEHGMVFPLESRIHVAIDGASQTADPGMLYATTGVRFPDGWHLAVEVSADDTLPESFGSAIPRYAVLGGESRPSQVSRASGGLPTLEDLKVGGQELVDRVRRAASGTETGVPPADGIRLQLLTHAILSGPGGSAAETLDAFGKPGWIPDWLRVRGDKLSGGHPALAGAGLEDIELELAAVCMPRGFIPISGWNLQASSPESRTGAPREVRRLVPAGSIYYFTVRRGGEALRDEALGSVYEALWMADLEPASSPDPDLETMRAHPARDGFGLVLPGLWRWNASSGRH